MRFADYSHDPLVGSVGFNVYDVDLAVINALRRTILSDIPVAAFSGEDDPSVDILKNSGPLHNQFILHRLGLVPIHLSDEETECLAADSYEMELNVHNDGKCSMLNVSTRDFVISRNGRELDAGDASRIFPANHVSKDHVLITRLRPGETLHVRGRPVLGTARSHAGHSPGFCTFAYLPDPTHVPTGNVLEDERAYMQNRHGEPQGFAFWIEPVCGLSARYLVCKAIEIIARKLNNLYDELQRHSVSDRVSIAPATVDGNQGSCGYNFTIRGEDDTVGSLLQSLMYKQHVRDAGATEVTYVGFMTPHPLEDCVVIRLALADSAASLKAHIDVLSSACLSTAELLQRMQDKWVEFTRAVPASPGTGTAI